MAVGVVVVVVAAVVVDMWGGEGEGAVSGGANLREGDIKSRSSGGEGGGDITHHTTIPWLPSGAWRSDRPCYGLPWRA